MQSFVLSAAKSLFTMYLINTHDIKFDSLRSLRLGAPKDNHAGQASALFRGLGLRESVPSNLPLPLLSSVLFFEYTVH